MKIQQVTKILKKEYEKKRKIEKVTGEGTKQNKIFAKWLNIHVALKGTKKIIIAEVNLCSLTIKHHV